MRALGLSIAIMLVALQLGPVWAQGSDIAQVIPDPYYVHHECDRLAAVNAPSIAVVQAQDVVRAACTAYSSDLDGDRWFAATNDARKTIDSYQPDRTQHAFKLVLPRQLVPQGAKLYVLFLAPSSSAWASSDLSDLRSKFEDLGQAIGAGNLAIWFDAGEDPDQIDTARCRYYFDTFKLAARGMNADGGPYVVTTAARPDLWSTANDLVVLDLGGVSIARATQILARFGTDLARQTAGKTPALAQLAAAYKSVVAKNPTAYQSVNSAFLRGT
jgi:hypothetical protein